MNRLACRLCLTLMAGLFFSAPVRSRAANYTVVGWNNLGMHCMDADFSVFSILPPYNVIHAQVIDTNGNLVTNALSLSVTYQAVADPAGSINTTSVGKANFWDYVLPLFGVALPPDVGLPVPGPNSFAMPGAGNVPQAMEYDAAAGWFAAYGIPITPYDNAHQKNTYPMMRLVAKLGGNTVGKLDIVLPVSDEMDCRVCHGSGSGTAAEPSGGWVNDANVQRDYRLNIVRLHDEKQAGQSGFKNALQAAGYDHNGLEATVNAGNPILCAACHTSEALPGSGQHGIPPLTESVHAFHATVVDPTNGMTLDSSANRSACYRCHPGSETKCLRGVMGAAVSANGQLTIQCQSCHGSMSLVGASNRTGWLDEPNCQACHAGDAVHNSGQIRYTSAFDSPGHLRVPANQRFATTANTPATGFSLYRFSRGHGGLYCEACHGSTHAEFPATHRNDNVQSIQLQGHVGSLVECNVCHGTQPATVTGGPHGMHPVGQTWVNQHPDVVESQGAAQCQVCHGVDYRGTVLSRSQADRTVSGFGTKQFWRGFQIGCYACHGGPGSDNANPNRPAVAANAIVATNTNTPVAVALGASDPDHNSLTLRIVSQASHGTVGLVGTAATYYPDNNFVGGDTFTFAAWDGQTDSNLGTVQVTVGGVGCATTVTPLSANFNEFAGSGNVSVATSGGCGWNAAGDVAWITITSGASGSGNGTVRYAVAPNPSPAARMGTLTVAGQTVTIMQAGSGVDVSGAWVSLTQTCKGSNATLRCSLRGSFTVQNLGTTDAKKISVAYYLSADATLDSGDTLLRLKKVSRIRAGQEMTRTVKLKLPAGVSASGKYVIALVDPDDALPDIDDTNNTVVSGPIP